MGAVAARGADAPARAGAALVGVPLTAPGGVAADGVVELAALGALAAGAVVAGAGAVVAGAVVAAAGVVTVTGVIGSEPAASLTREAAMTAIESTATTAIATIGAFHPLAAASRVRAAAPHRRHHSCSGPSGALHSGQVSPAGSGAITPEGLGVPLAGGEAPTRLCWLGDPGPSGPSVPVGGEAAAAFTRRQREGG